MLYRRRKTIWADNFIGFWNKWSVSFELNGRSVADICIEYLRNKLFIFKRHWILFLRVQSTMWFTEIWIFRPIWIWQARQLICRWCETRIFFSSTRSLLHYSNVIMGAIVYSTVYSVADQRKHQSSSSLVFVRGIHRSPVNSPHKWPVTRKMFPFDDVIMVCLHFKPVVNQAHHHL